jgi:hypothetical protein
LLKAIGARLRPIMELIPDETALSSSEDATPAFDKLIQETVQGRRIPPFSGSRIPRAPSKRRRLIQPSHEGGVHSNFHLLLHASPQPEDFDNLLQPKVELPDHDVRMDDLQEAESKSTADNIKALSRPKRPRGRPRKHPIQSLEISSKLQKGRSKTGCITCRRRKKKCDETKPVCKLAAC